MVDYETILRELQEIRGRIEGRERVMEELHHKNTRDCNLYWRTVKACQEEMSAEAFEDLELDLGIQGWDRETP